MKLLFSFYLLNKEKGSPRSWIVYTKALYIHITLNYVYFFVRFVCLCDGFVFFHFVRLIRREKMISNDEISKYINNRYNVLMMPNFSHLFAQHVGNMGWGSPLGFHAVFLFSKLNSQCKIQIKFLLNSLFPIKIFIE